MGQNSILQWNCRGLKANFNELLILLSLFNPKICCLQETFLTPNDNLEVRNYSSYHYINNDCQRASGGASIMIHSTVPHRKIDLNTNLQAIAIKASLNKSITICSIYIPPNKRISQNDLENLLLQLPQPYIICGDFNGHSELWGCSDTNDRGKILEDFITENNLCLFNSNQHTYLHPGSGSFTAIDLSLCHPSLYLDYEWKVCEDSHGSDHFPIIMYETEETDSDKIPKWNFKKANWEKFNILCHEKLLFNSFENSEDPMLSFTETLIDISNQCIAKSSTNSFKKKKPWFNDECKEAIKKRKDSLKRFKQYPTKTNLNACKILRAKARRIIKQAKRSSWKDFISKINTRTPMTTIWNMIKKINGKNQNMKYSHIKVDDKIYESKEEIANILGRTFKSNSSSVNYNPQFKRHKQETEMEELNFETDTNENYNLPFTISELENSLKNAHDSATGADEVHYQLLKHLPRISLQTLLNIFNRIWEEGTFPESWTKATIIPIPKPNKDHTNPTNYRPIALTSCLCKTMERMINNRLNFYLESNNIISEHQSGFRKNRSTADQLVRLESYIRNAFVKKQHVVAIFFDLEKAYDTTWKHGILKDIHKIGLKGNLPKFISNFLSNRCFRVKVGSSFSDVYEQEQGVPQGSILSPTLFNIKINNIIKCLDDDVNCSLYVDDFLICYRSKDMKTIETKLQKNLNKIEKWTVENGFKFSMTKTNCVHFCQEHRLHLDPALKLYNNPIPIVDQAKFLGVIFDKKLSFIPHINTLKVKCQKALNVLKLLSHSDWGGDKKSLLNLYRSLIRSKLDYGCIIYGSARKSYLKKLDTIHHQGLRLALGAFRTSPVQSLYSEAQEPSLYDRRKKLSLQYVTKLASNPNNPVYNDIFNSPNKVLFQNKPNFIKPLGLRIEPLLNESNINVKNIKPFKLPVYEPWTIDPPNIIFDLNINKKSTTNPLFYQTKFLEIKSQYKDYISIYTDGSKQDNKVGCASVHKQETAKIRLPDHSSIFSAEAIALNIALCSIQNNINKKFIVFSDSMSVLQTLKQPDHPNPLIQQFFRKYVSLCRSKTIIFCWIPSHINIKGNEMADQEAKDALNMDIANVKIPFTDKKQQINEFIMSECQTKWQQCFTNKLLTIKPNFNNKYHFYCKRKDQVILTRCRIGHSKFSHVHLLNNERAPQCINCNEPLTVKHILLNCTNFDRIRSNHFNVDNLQKLFLDIKQTTILEYLKEIDFYDKI